MQLLKHNKLAVNEDGVSAVEFGLIAPVVIMMIMGVMDIGHNYYVRVVTNGAMQEAARSVSLESAASIVKQQLIDLRVNNEIKTIVPTAKPVDESKNFIEKEPSENSRDGDKPVYEDVIYPERKYYKTFADAASARQENFVDGNDDGICNDGETYVDENRNGQWDEDVGSDGVGQAHDVVVMKVRFKYKRLFPTASILGFSEYVTVESDSVLANQPYAKQTAAGDETGNCT